MGPRAPTVSAARALSIGAPALVVRKGVSSWPAKKKESSIELIEVKVFFFFLSFLLSRLKWRGKEGTCDQEGEAAEGEDHNTMEEE